MEPGRRRGDLPSVQLQATHAAMATEWTVVIEAVSEREAEPLFRMAVEEIDRVEALLSRFCPTSEIARIVREAPCGFVTTDPEVFQLLEFAQDWSSRTDGAFDTTVAPLLRAYGFPSPPPMPEAKVGYRAVLLDAATRSVHFADGRLVELDLGAIGKGHAVDCVVQLLREHGVENALISAGSSTIYGMGAPSDEAGWTIHVPVPGGRILLRDRAISTSACTEHFVERDRLHHGHLFDPRSGEPVRGMRQTHVLAASALESEVLSTAAFVLGLEAAANLLEELPAVQGLLVAETGQRAVRWPSAVGHTVRSEAL